MNFRHTKAAKTYPPAVEEVQHFAQPRHQQGFGIRTTGFERIFLPRFDIRDFAGNRNQRECCIFKQLFERCAKGAKTDIRWMFEDLKKWIRGRQRFKDNKKGPNKPSLLAQDPFVLKA